MYCGTLTTKAPDSMAMWRIEEIQPSVSSAVGAHQISGAPWYTRQRASGMRFSQQISPPTRPTGVCTGSRSSPGADAVEQALLVGRHELAVPVQQTARAEGEHRVVERAAVALVDADDAVDVVARAARDERVHERAGHVDGVRVHPLPELVEAAEARGLGGPRVAGVQRDEHLGEHGELRALGRGLAEQPHGLPTQASASRMTGVAWIAATRTTAMAPTLRLRANRIGACPRPSMTTSTS